MRKILMLALVPVVAAAFTAGGAGQTKKDQKSKDQVNVLDTTDQDYAALAGFPGVTGKIMSLSPNNTAMTLRVEWQVQEPKDNAKQPKAPPPKFGKGGLTPAQVQNRLNQIQKIKNPAQQQAQLVNLMNQIQNQAMQQQVQQIQWVQKQLQQAANNFKTVTYAKEFELDVKTGARVVKRSLGMEYDDKGNIKEYTPEELKKLKDSVYTDFFKSTMDEVTPGLTVYVVLQKPKTEKDKTTKDKTKPDDKDKAPGDARGDNGQAGGNDKDKAKPGIDINDILNPQPPAKDNKPGAKDNKPGAKDDPLKSVEPTHPKTAPTIQAILILSEVGVNDSTPSGVEPKKKKKKDNN